MIATVWRFEVKPDAVAAFESIYGPRGDCPAGQDCPGPGTGKGPGYGPGGGKGPAQQQ